MQELKVLVRKKKWDARGEKREVGCKSSRAPNIGGFRKLEFSFLYYLFLKFSFLYYLFRRMSLVSYTIYLNMRKVRFSYLNMRKFILHI